MSTEKQELLSTQMNAEGAETYSANELFTRTEIENTPFVIVRDNEKNVKHILFGKFRINKNPLPVETDIEAWLKKHQYNIIIAMQMAMKIMDKEIGE